MKPRHLAIALFPLALLTLPALAQNPQQKEQQQRLKLLKEAEFWKKLDKLLKDVGDLGGYVITANDDGSFTLALEEPNTQSACNNNPPVATLHKTVEPAERLGNGLNLLKAQNEALSRGEKARIKIDRTANACVKKGDGKSKGAS